MNVSVSPPLDSARRLFLDRGALPPDLEGTPIARSWRRCADMGLDLTAVPRVAALTEREMAREAERHARLRRVSRAEMDLLRGEAARSGGVVLLSDADGLILEASGAEHFQRKAARVSLRPGVSWNEAHLGTNAIGTALAEGRAVEVRGAEHYFEPHAFLTCSAMPIRGPDGRALGILDLSGRAGAGHAGIEGTGGTNHAMGLVGLAVSQIEHRLFEGQFSHCEVLRLHGSRDLLGTHREGILVFEGDRLIAANRHALGLLDLSWDALNRSRWEDLFDGPLGAWKRDGSGGPRDHRGRSFHARLDRPVARPLPAARFPVEGRSGPYLTPATRADLERARRLIEADVPVFIRGETGVGKEVFARRLHALSARAAQPFVAVNCAALPESLIESELFGYEEGAFTGARRKGHKGLLRDADGGVLFLDEIGDMPLEHQARLLRVLQEREVTPLGGSRRIPVDIALACASHRDLDTLVAEGRFRQDLFFRVAQFTVTLPPLRNMPDRREVIPRLWDEIGGSRGITLDPRSIDLLAGQSWPGNFRQLTSALKVLAALADPGQCLTPDHLPEGILGRREVGSPSPEAPPPVFRPPSGVGEGALETLTREAMRAALDACGGNVSQAARRLGVHRSTLYRRLTEAERG
ncbi:MAG: sigma-54-dependent Fis family transcriptional regulator [Rhodospirillum sp.]|nr:sigma-54-dependent Fis family transcriptional regulator [Rhodospirillum sp.]MCF8489893.1 sigma-54-dependent Fis family transcriptional regulator [Rhodospirillum sp.]